MQWKFLIWLLCLEFNLKQTSILGLWRSSISSSGDGPEAFLYVVPHYKEQSYSWEWLVSQLVKRFPINHRTWKFIAIFTGYRIPPVLTVVFSSSLAWLFEPLQGIWWSWRLLLQTCMWTEYVEGIVGNYIGGEVC